MADNTATRDAPTDTSLTLGTEEARKLQDGISIINSLITRATGASHHLISEVASSSRSDSQGHSEGRANQSQACSRALQALRSVRQHFDEERRKDVIDEQRRKDAVDEQRRNFSPYTSGRGKGKGRSRSCSFKMFCLSSPLDTHVPTSVSYKETLCKAGLGEKTVTIPDSSCSRDEFWSIITSAYPKLSNCGGFELLRCISQSREIEPISRSVAKSPKLLKSVLSNRKIFIRPLQKDLDVRVAEDLVSTDDSVEFFEECIYCNQSFELNSLREHAQDCQKKKQFCTINIDDDCDFESSKQKKSIFELPSDNEDLPLFSKILNGCDYSQSLVSNQEEVVKILDVVL